MGLILLAAVVFRITLVPLPATLSDDLYRYRWEGKLQAAGGNPYASTPADPQWAHLKDSTWPSVDGKQIRAVYGPLIELEQLAVYRVAAFMTEDTQRQTGVFRGVSAIADLGVIVALLTLLRARGLPLERVLIYAWCPLPMVEFWVSGHNDALVILLICLALACAARSQSKSGFVLLSLAAAAKVWPLLLFPAFTGWKPRRIVQGVVILSGVAACVVIPYGWSVFDNRDFTSGFVGGWRNNDSLFGLVLALVGDPRFAKRTTFVAIGILSIVISLLRWPLERKALATVGALLAFSSNVHPWYATWLLPMVVIDPIPAALLFVSLVPLFYESVIGWTINREWIGVSWLRWPVYAGVLIALVQRTIIRRKKE